MRIAQLISRFPYFGNDTVIGGTASSLYNLIKQQVELNKVDIIAQFPGLTRSSDNPSLNFIPLNVKSSPSSIRFGLEYTSRILVDSISRTITYDIIHGHSGYLDYIISTSLYAKSKRANSVQTIYCPVTARRSLIPMNRLISNSAKHIDLFIAISKNVAKSLSQIGIPENKIRIIPPAIDINRFQPGLDKCELRNKLGLPNDVPIILFVGSTKPVKNLETVLDVLAYVIEEFRDTILIITTELEHKDHYNRSKLLLEKLEILKIERSVIRMGIVQNMPELMAAADVLIAPFLNTNGPSDYFLAALEAMSCGKPVVVSSVGGMPEVIGANNGFLFSPKDVNGMGKAIINLFQNPEKSEEMGMMARQTILEGFNPSWVSKATEVVYNEVCR